MGVRIEAEGFDGAAEEDIHSVVERMLGEAAGEVAGTVEGDGVTFVALLMMNGGPFEVTYRATIENGVMTGTVDFGDYGSGTFTGVRAKSESSGLSLRRGIPQSSGCLI